ncbi:hypothetical protein FJZ21_01490, partial [Candidatus Pacearchaeota archaeon]|nr:hypothetical protein [Candidatus Pacearchaeota archaeon]
MKRGGFLFVVVAFAIFSAFVLYLDYTKDCGSVICLAEYIKTGDASPRIYDLKDSFISEIIYPFVNPVDEVGLSPDEGVVGDGHGSIDGGIGDGNINGGIGEGGDPVGGGEPMGTAAPITLEPNPVVRNADKPLVINGIGFATD